MLSMRLGSASTRFRHKPVSHATDRQQMLCFGGIGFDVAAEADDDMKELANFPSIP